MPFDKAYGPNEKSIFEEKQEQLQEKLVANSEDRLASVLEKLVEQTRQQGLSADQLETLLTRVGMTSAEAMRLSLKPENSEATHISDYFTTTDMAKYGSFDMKPKLAVKTWFCGIEEKDDRLTASEIEGYNKLPNFAEARNGQWKAERKRNGRHEELFISVPFVTISDRMELPSLLLILLELNGGPSTANIHTLLKQLEFYKGLAVSKGATAAELEAALNA